VWSGEYTSADDRLEGSSAPDSFGRSAAAIRIKCMTWPLRALTLSIAFAFSVVSAAALPALTPETPIAGERRVDSPASADALASAGPHSLALFSRCMSACSYMARGDVFGQIINEDGSTRASFPVAVSGRFEEGKAAFWTGEVYVAIYTVRDAAFAVRISSGGVVGDPIEIAASPAPMSGFLAVRGADRILITWSFVREEGSPVQVARLLRIDGEPTSEPWLLRADWAWVSGGSAKGNEFFLVGGQPSGTAPYYRDVLTGPVLEGRAWEPYLVPDAAAVSGAPLVPTPTGYVLLWKTGYLDGEGEIRATELTATGAGASWPLRVGAIVPPAVEVFSGGALAVFHDAVRYLAFLFDPAADHDVPTVAFPLTGAKSNIRSYPLPRTAWDGRNIEFLWSEDRFDYWGPTRMKFMEIDPGTRAVSPEATIGATPEIQESPAVARGTNVDLVAWLTYQPDSATTVVDAARLGASGMPLDGAGIRLSTNDTWQHGVSVAASSSIFLAVWQEERPDGSSRVLAARVAEDGSVLDRPPQVVSDNAMLSYSGGTDVVWAGDQFLVVWTSGEETPYWTNHTVKAARIRSDGTVLDPGGFDLLPETPGSERDAQLAYDGENVLVAWTAVTDRRVYRYNQPLFDIHATLVSRDGSPRGAIVKIAEEDESETVPRVAFDGKSYLVTWKAGSLVNVQDALYASIVTLEGRVVGAPPESRSRSVRLGMHQRPPSHILMAEAVGSYALAGTGDGWLVAWELAGDDRDNDVLWRGLRGDGALTDIAPVATDPRRAEASPSMSARDGVVSIVYTSVQRVMSRRAGF
jgi:hypothetical protein